MPTQASDLIPDQPPCRLLQLPGPTLNELGKAEWPVTSSELSKAFRKLSILVHPDKNPTDQARQAFEQLKEAYNELKDADKLVGMWHTCATQQVLIMLSSLLRAAVHQKRSTSS